MSGPSVFAALKSGEELCIEEVLAVADAIDFPNEIRYSRVYVGEHVERIVFADGTVFVREAVKR